jgi:hypothetical protein
MLYMKTLFTQLHSYLRNRDVSLLFAISFTRLNHIGFRKQICTKMAQEVEAMENADP